MSLLDEAYPNLPAFLNSTDDPVTHEAEALEFLAALGGPVESTAFCFQVIPNIAAESLPAGIVGASAKHRTGFWKFVRKWLVGVNRPEHGGLCGVYVCVNETDGKGRKSENVVSVRALFVELDHGSLTTAHISEFVEHFSPSIVVESSPGKLHCYWLLESGSCPLDKFSRCQQVLAKRFQSLRAGLESKDLPRVLRIPGFLHLKNLSAPFWVKLHHCSTVRFTPDQVFEACGIDADFVNTFLSSPEGNQARSGVASDIRESVDPKYLEYLGAQDGKRNEALFHYCYQHLFQHRGVTFDEALGILGVVNQRNKEPLPDLELRSIAESALRRFSASGGQSSISPGRAREVLGEWKPEDRKKLPESWNPDGTETFEEHSFVYNYNRVDMACPVSDAALADRIIQKYGARINYSSLGGFYVYNNLIWTNSNKSGEALLYRFMRESFSQVPQEEKVASWFSTPLAYQGFRRDVQSSFRLRCTREMLEKNIDLLVTADSFNTASDADYLACPNGIIDLRAGQLVASDPKYRLTHLTGCAFDPKASCPTWEYFISSAMGDRPELIDYLQRVTGYFLSGRTHLQALFVAFGQPGTGKSVYLSTLAKLLAGYHTELHKSVILAGKNYENARMSSLAQAIHSRLATVQEVEEKDVWEGTIVKQISGNDPVVAKMSHKDTMQFVPTFKVVVRANMMPTADQLDEGLWERLRFLPFNVKFRGTAREDQGLAEKLLAELPGILNWSIAGYRILLDHGLGEPALALAQKKSVQREAEPVRNFIEDCCEIVDEHKNGMKFTDFMICYESYCRDNGLEIGNKSHIKRFLLSEAGCSENNSRLPEREYPVRMVNIAVKTEYKGRYKSRSNIIPFDKSK